MMNKVVGMLFLAVGIVGCSKQEVAPAKINPPGTTAMPSLAGSGQSTPAQAVAAQVPVQAEAGKVDPSKGAKLPPATPRDLGTDGKPDLGALTATMQDWCYWTDRFPTNVEELVTTKYLEKIPTPPAGQKYVVNRTANRVDLVHQ